MDAPTVGGAPKHGAEIKCPKCGVDATYRSWNKQKVAEEEADVAILQRLNDRSGYILRYFHTKITRRHNKGWEVAEFRKFEKIEKGCHLICGARRYLNTESISTQG
ncbi:MAG: hypothetical protein ACLR78_13885 [Roseburia sp.]